MSQAQQEAVATAQQTPLYFPSDDPRYSVLYNYIKVDKDNSGLVVEDVGSTLGRTGDFYNAANTTTKLQFIIQSGSDFRIEMSKLALAFTYIFRAKEAADLDSDINPLQHGINPYALFYLISSISLKINDSAQSVENYESTNEFGMMAQARMELKYDNDVLQYLHESLFTPINETAAWAGPDTSSGAGFVAGDATYNRSAIWGTPLGEKNQKFLMFSDLFNFCNVRAISNNIRKMDIELTLRTLADPKLVFTNAVGVAAAITAQLAISDVKVILHDNRLSPSQNIESIQEKTDQKSERFSYLVANCGTKSYTPGSELPYMQVSNLCMTIFRIAAPWYPLVGDAYLNYAQYIPFGITSYLIRYGADLYPSREISSGVDGVRTIFYNLLKKAAGKQGLTNHNFGIQLIDFSYSKFMIGARFYDSTYPHLSVTKEIRATFQTTETEIDKISMFYCHWRYRTTIVGGDGTVVIQD